MLDFQQYFPYNEVFDFIKKNQILFTVFITILILKMKEISKANMYLSGIVYFLGTFFHELAHYIMALITTFKLPGQISIFPKSEVVNGRKTITLGYVEVRNSSLNILNAFLIGIGHRHRSKRSGDPANCTAFRESIAHYSPIGAQCR